MMIESPSSPETVHVKEYRAWVEAEWGTVDSFWPADAAGYPAPILALQDGKLIGGLSFTRSSIPDTEDTAVWINTLLVAPAFRRNGVGSRLVSAAQVCARRQGISTLYAYTEIMQLYLNLDWCIHSRSGAHAILRKAI